MCQLCHKILSRRESLKRTPLVASHLVAAKKKELFPRVWQPAQDLISLQQWFQNREAKVL